MRFTFTDNLCLAIGALMLIVGVLGFSWQFLLAGSAIIWITLEDDLDNTPIP